MVENKKTTIALIGIVLLLSMVFALSFKNSVVSKNKYDFGKSVKGITAESVSFNEIVPFEWDMVYTFDPYTSKQEIEKTIGFKSNNISETVSEGMTQLIFVKENKVVCDVCGYSDNLGYRISFRSSNETYSIIRYKDDAVFSVERIGDIVVLSKQ